MGLGCSADACTGPSGDRLRENWPGKVNGIHVSFLGNKSEIGSGEAHATHQALGDSFVQGQSQDKRVGKRVGNVEGIEQRWDLGFPSKAVQTFGDIENQVPARSLRKSFGKVADVADRSVT